jgi:hypothetical protein
MFARLRSCGVVRHARDHRLEIHAIYFVRLTSRFSLNRLGRRSVKSGLGTQMERSITEALSTFARSDSPL